MPRSFNGKSLPLRGKRVLVAEDDFLVAMDLRVAIEDAGGIASVERSAKALEEAIDSSGLDCVVLDVQLEDGTSFAAAKLLKRRRVPFVLMSGYEQTILPPELEGSPYLAKPVARHTLVEFVANCVANAAASRGFTLH